MSSDAGQQEGAFLKQVWRERQREREKLVKDAGRGKKESGQNLPQLWEP
jgi:hypothetical protein